MVSKIAVIALVAVVAVPILLGYGLNFENTEKSIYSSNDDAMDATGLLATGTEYNYVEADPYAMNSNKFAPAAYIGNLYGSSYPDYVETTSAYSPIQLFQYHSSYTNLPTGMVTGSDSFSGFLYYQIDFEYLDPVGSNTYLSVNVYNNQTLLGHYDRVFSVKWDSTTTTAQIMTYSSNNRDNPGAFTVNNATNIQYYIGVGPFNADWQYNSIRASGNSNIDLIGGFKLQRDMGAWAIGYASDVDVHEVTFTADLSTMENNSIMYFGLLAIKKTSDAIYATNATYQDQMVELYYNPSSTSDNVYQFTLDYFNGKIRADYIGQWPNKIGVAKSYLSYEMPLDIPSINIKVFEMHSVSGSVISQYPAMVRTNTADFPIMRFDHALIRGYATQTITDATYSPGSFRTNPGTTLTNVTKLGTSITFGTNSYTVDKDDGTITLDGHSIPIEGIRFTSFWNGTGYDNAIGGTVVSQSLDPASLQFSGKWSFNLNTDSNELKTVTEMKWIPGHFAWNGVDADFKIVGFMSSIGIFIALGIYARRSGAKVLPLMLICGGAAAMFFFMI